MNYPQAKELYQSIKEILGYQDQALSALGYTEDKFNKAIDQSVKQGIKPETAAKAVFNLWAKANDIKWDNATHFEMVLMGFRLENNLWIHTDYPDIIVTVMQQNELKMEQIEALVLNHPNYKPT